MKRFSVAVLAVVTSLLCIGASVWEGAAAVSLNGELPDEGYYVATKSFPRNTVVDVINLETSQSIRVTVAAGLESPGLLAMISRDAAAAISLGTRSIGRIRMVMPSDPVGFSRFTEGTRTGRDPDFDPRAAIAAASPSGQPIQEYTLPSERPAPTPAAAAPAASPATAPAERASRPEAWPPVYPAVPSRQDSAAAAAPAAAPANTADTAPAADQADNDRIVDIPQTNTASDNLVVVEPAPGTFPGYNGTGGTYGWTSPPNTDAAEIKPPVQPADPGPAPEPPAVDMPVKLPVQPTVSPTPSPDAQLVLVPAEQRPPEAAVVTGLPPEAEIAPLPKRNVPAVNAGQTAAAPESSPPLVAQSAPPSQPSPTQYPSQPLTQGMAQDPASNPATPPGQAPVTSPIASPSTPAPSNSGTVSFSVPHISKLERGKYYLQLAAYTQPELVETEIARISPAYPLAVQSGGSPGKPLYRLLIGPVNHGESGALLQRFKGSGYRDAFIRTP